MTEDRLHIPLNEPFAYSLSLSLFVSHPFSPLLRFKNGNQLRSYQLEGLNWLLYCYHRRQNSILADEMGLGKTIQSTSFLNHLHTKLNIQGPFLIVTPLSTIGNWEREIKTWTNMNVVVYHGRDTSRHLIVDTEFYYKGRDVKEKKAGERCGGNEPIFLFDVNVPTLSHSAGQIYSWNLQV